jgi:hypothetical protein
MELVKRNTKEFKEIKSIIGDYMEVTGRRRSILLYSLKPYHSLKEAVLLNNQKENSGVLYDPAYDSLHDYIFTRSEKLYRDEDSGLYYFKRSPASKWIEMPFSFTGKLKKQVTSARKV